LQKIATLASIIFMHAQLNTLGQQMSFLQDSMCTRLSAPMHEMGHNIGFYHSGLDSDAYGDKSGK
jgi:hypothetical protein